MVRRGSKSKGTGIPTLSKRESQLVFPFPEVLHRIGLVLEALMIAGPAGSKVRIIHFHAVHFHFVKAKGSCIEPCPDGNGGSREMSNKNGADSVIFFKSVGNPAGIAIESGAAKQASLKYG